MGGGDGVDVPFRGTDADGGVHAVREDLAVAGFAGPGRHADGFDGFVSPVFVGDEDLEFDLRDHIDGDLIASDEFGESHLDAAAHDLRDRHAADVFGNQCLFDVLEFLLADDGFDFIHEISPPLVIQSVEGRVGAFAVLCDVETDLLFLLGNSQRSDPLREEDA